MNLILLSTLSIVFAPLRSTIPKGLALIFEFSALRSSFSVPSARDLTIADHPCHRLPMSLLLPNATLHCNLHWRIFRRRMDVWKQRPGRMHCPMTSGEDTSTKTFRQ
ncbi:hypothetical protein BKA59DRAFT_119383 [Fusarium tricinctum]|uniref:Secreted protein n=1 Tax=Fusarium tricinctum TaxID=61284 RepID=A0A8K0WGT1_9HYPO|nr:hypothetical protein BKA59DRAFT_119383 [Fusarium tricinctum]